VSHTANTKRHELERACVRACVSVRRARNRSNQVPSPAEHRVTWIRGGGLNHDEPNIDHQSHRRCTVATHPRHPYTAREGSPHLPPAILTVKVLLNLDLDLYTKSTRM
jgi:hypothetical protein